MFNGRKLLVATKHRKERVIAPLVEKALGVSCFTNKDFDTDALGTFTGEVARQADPVTTARTKCLMAMELTGYDLVVASEGSFGGHPYLYFIPADEEILMLKDRKNNLEIVVKELSCQTNFNGTALKNKQDLLDFTRSVHFPSHGVILRRAKDDVSSVEKGITDWKRLNKIFHRFMLEFGSAYVETDMRAMFNPTRMKVIEAATKKLIAKALSPCPQCKAPGFGITATVPGLPCRRCGFPTRSTIKHVYSCQKCLFNKEQLYPGGSSVEDPGFCDFCNP